MNGNLLLALSLLGQNLLGGDGPNVCHPWAFTSSLSGLPSVYLQLGGYGRDDRVDRHSGCQMWSVRSHRIVAAVVERSCPFRPPLPFDHAPDLHLGVGVGRMSEVA